MQVFIEGSAPFPYTGFQGSDRFSTRNCKFERMNRSWERERERERERDDRREEETEDEENKKFYVRECCKKLHVWLWVDHISDNVDLLFQRVNSGFSERCHSQGTEKWFNTRVVRPKKWLNVLFRTQGLILFRASANVT